MDPDLKSILRGLSLKLRHLLEGYYDEEGRWRPGDLERRLNELGVWRERTPKPIDEMPHLSKEDLDARKVVDAYLQYRKEAGVPLQDSVAEFVRESAYTWANRLFALRCMEARGLIDEVILQKEVYGWRSLQHNRLALKHPELCATEDEGLFLVIFQEFERRSKELPQLFDPSAPAVALRPSVAALKKCITLLSGREPVSGNEFACDAIFEAPDAFGWAYQYWNEEEKNRVFEKVRTTKAKIEGADIIPTTCIYTEPYMVKFLVQNSLGVLWMGIHPESKLVEKWEYYVEDADRAPVDKKEVAKITFLDPACGSGHFLLEAFDIFYDMYKEEGTFSACEEICASILNNNLFGIDIDERAVQISIVVLWMKAREKAPMLEATDLSEFHDHLMATNIRLPKDKDHLENFLNKHPEDHPLRAALETVLEGLENVHELGSLLQIEEPVENELRYIRNKLGAQRTLFDPQIDEAWETWSRNVVARLKSHFATEALAADQAPYFFGHAASKGLALFDLLARRYDVVAMNPPYLGTSKLHDRVREYLGHCYGYAKQDLFTAFIVRGLTLVNSNGYLSMVTRNAWMMLNSFARLRKELLMRNSIVTSIDLGSQAFDTPLHDGVSVTLNCFQKTQLPTQHEIVYLNLSQKMPIIEKEKLLRARIAANSTTRRPQDTYTALQGNRIILSLSQDILKILSKNKTIIESCEVRQGLVTANNDRFVRTNHEPPAKNQGWCLYTKGGGYARWAGSNYYYVDWRQNGARIDLTGRARVQNVGYYFREGLTYGMTGRSLGLRHFYSKAIFGHAGPCVFPDGKTLGYYAAILNSRFASFLIRVFTSKPGIEVGQVSSIPVPEKHQSIASLINDLGYYAIRVKEKIISETDICDELYEPRFWGDSLYRDVRVEVSHSLTPWLLVAEGQLEQLVFSEYGLSDADCRLVLEDTGVPAGWFPLIQGYDSLPMLPTDLPELPREVVEFLKRQGRRTLPHEELADLKRRLSILFEAGPTGTRGVGARIPIPAESFLEELSQKLEVHPISIYWLLKEGVEREAWRCLPEEGRITADRFTITILRLLGHRWPKQIDAGEPKPDWADPDGIIPLTDGTGESTLLDRVRERILAVGDDVTASEHKFADIIGKSLDEWLRTKFFEHHAKQFKKRPIAWHIESRPSLSSSHGRGRRRRSRNFSGPAFSCLVYYHELDADLLPKIRNQYVGPLRKRYKTELRTLENMQTPTADQTERRVTLENLIEELKEFDAKLEKVITNGFDSTSLRKIVAQEPLDKWTSIDGKAPPPLTQDLFYIQEKAYNPDLNDGVRVNIAPLQKAGLLAADVLSKKDVDRALRDRAEWRADERRWCREEKLPRPGWWKTKGEDA